MHEVTEYLLGSGKEVMHRTDWQQGSWYKPSVEKRADVYIAAHLWMLHATSLLTVRCCMLHCSSHLDAAGYIAAHLQMLHATSLHTFRCFMLHRCTPLVACYITAHIQMLHATSQHTIKCCMLDRWTPLDVACYITAHIQMLHAT